MNPAFRLLAACCRWPDDDRRAEAVRQAAARDLDWDELCRLALRHRVEPLTAHGLRNAGIAVPVALEQAEAKCRAATLRDLGETLRIDAALDAQGIVHRFLKGIPLGIAAFGTPTLKHSWDIDVLVAPGDAVAAARCLALLGYAPAMPPRPLNLAEFVRWSVVSKEAEFRSPRGSTVELHWRVGDHPQLLARLDASAPARFVPVLDTHCVATFEDAANLAYLAVHGTAHGWFRLKWIADFNALLAHAPVGGRADLLDRARSHGVGTCLDTALALSQVLFGEPEKRCSTLRPAACLSLQALGSDDEDHAHALAARVRWRMASGIRYILRELIIRARGSLDRAHHPLPRGFDLLYPLLRLPFWLDRRFKATSARH